MERRKRYQVRHSKNERIGILTGLLDCEGNEIKTGDYIKVKGKHYDGIVLWHREQKCLGFSLAFGILTEIHIMQIVMESLLIFLTIKVCEWNCYP